MACKGSAVRIRLPPLFSAISIYMSISSLSLEAQISQLVCPLLDFSRMLPEEPQAWLNALSDYPFGGFIVFHGDIQTTPFFLSQLQHQSDIPLLIASDIESGAGQQIQGATRFPSNMALGALNLSESVFFQGQITAREAKALGVNWAFAPVMDLSTEPQNPIVNIRSYGESPKRVAELGCAFIRGCQSEGVLASAKHFPGHGSTTEDSHTSLPLMQLSVEECEQADWLPFRAAIDAGVASIMTGHLACPQLDDSLKPATLSYRVMTEILRERLGFDGLIVTDALIMEGVKQESLSPEEIALASLLAGCDMVLMPEDPFNTVQFLCQAVRDGRLSRQRVEASLDRIFKLKNQYLLPSHPYSPDPRILTEINKGTLQQQAMQQFFDTLTLVQDPLSLLPLKPRDPLKLVIYAENNPLAGEKMHAFLRAQGLDCEACFVDENTPTEDFEELSLFCQADNGLLVISVFSQIAAWKNRTALSPHFEAWCQDLEQSQQGIMIAFGNPYLGHILPVHFSYICAYETHPVLEEMVATKLFQPVSGFVGQLPITLNR